MRTKFFLARIPVLFLSITLTLSNSAFALKPTETKEGAGLKELANALGPPAAGLEEGRYADAETVKGTVQKEMAETIADFRETEIGRLEIATSKGKLYRPIFYDSAVSQSKTGPASALIRGANGEWWIHLHLGDQNKGLLFRLVLAGESSLGKQEIVGLAQPMGEPVLYMDSIKKGIDGFVPLEPLLEKGDIEWLSANAWRVIGESKSTLETAISRNRPLFILAGAVSPRSEELFQIVHRNYFDPNGFYIYPESGRKYQRVDFPKSPDQPQPNSGLEEVANWIQRELGLQEAVPESLAELVAPLTAGRRHNQVPLRVDGEIETVVRLTPIPQGPISLNEAGREILVQEGLLSKPVESLLDEMGAVREVQPDARQLAQQLLKIKERVDPSRPKAKTLVIVSPETAGELAAELSKNGDDSGWELPVVIVGVSSDRLKPANVSQMPMEHMWQAFLGYLSELLSWADLLPGRVVEQVKSTFLDGQHQTLFLSTGA